MTASNKRKHVEDGDDDEPLPIRRGRTSQPSNARAVKGALGNAKGLAGFLEADQSKTDILETHVKALQKQIVQLEKEIKRPTLRTADTTRATEADLLKIDELEDKVASLEGDIDRLEHENKALLRHRLAMESGAEDDQSRIRKLAEIIVSLESRNHKLEKHSDFLLQETDNMTRVIEAAKAVASSQNTAEWQTYMKATTDLKTAMEVYGRYEDGHGTDMGM